MGNMEQSQNFYPGQKQKIWGMNLRFKNMWDGSQIRKYEFKLNINFDWILDSKRLSETDLRSENMNLKWILGFEEKLWRECEDSKIIKIPDLTRYTTWISYSWMVIWNDDEVMKMHVTPKEKKNTTPKPNCTRKTRMVQTDFGHTYNNREGGTEKWGYYTSNFWRLWKRTWPCVHPSLSCKYIQKIKKAKHRACRFTFSHVHTKVPVPTIPKRHSSSGCNTRLSYTNNPFTVEFTTL